MESFPSTSAESVNLLENNTIWHNMEIVLASTFEVDHGPDRQAVPARGVLVGGAGGAPEVGDHLDLTLMAGGIARLQETPAVGREN